MDDVQADFNSSDIEFDEEPNTSTTFHFDGQATINRMIEDAQRDRIASKKTVKQLKQQGLAPGTSRKQSLWVKRFEAFRTHVLRQSADTPFTGEDLIRFFDSIIGKMRLHDSDKPGPNLDTVHVGYAVLVQYGIFKWPLPAFKMTPHDAARFQAFTFQALKEKRLTKGRWRERAWVGFVTLSRMVRAYLEHFMKNGTLNFDVIIYKCFSVVFISSLGCRSGDVSRTRGYTGTEYMTYRDIELFLPNNVRPEPDFSELRATVTMRYLKGKKQTLNDDTVRYLRPLDDVQYIHVCPIALLMVHTLRNGLVYGNTVEEVLQDAAKQSDKRVRWKYPDRPVLCSISSGPHRCDLASVTATHQVMNTVKQMGVISGVLSRIYGHSLRLGAIRDFAHIDKSSASRTIDEVRQFAGHTHGAMVRGVTERYTGEVAQETYNLRAAGGGPVHRREPKFAEDSEQLKLMNRKVTDEELQAHLDSAKPGTLIVELSRNDKGTAIRHIRASREANLRKSAPARPMAWTMSERTLATAPGMLDRPRHESKSAPLLDSDDIVNLSVIDPALLDEESLSALIVTESDIVALQTTIFSQANDDTEEPQVDVDKIATDMAMVEESARLVLSPDDRDGHQTPSNAANWINSYAGFNVIACSSFAKNWLRYCGGKKSFEDSIGPYCMRGDSRDEPTPFMYVCERTPGCTHRTGILRQMQSHMEICTTDYAVAKSANAALERLSCPHPGCEFQTTCGASAMRMHKLNKHEWTPKRCDQCPEDKDTVYQTQATFRNHMDLVHSGRWPTKCKFPLCQEVREFNSYVPLANHLESKHNLNTQEERAPYFPARSARQVWVNQTCVLPDCQSQTKFQSRATMLRHLKATHKMSQDAAEELVDRKGVTQSKVGETRVIGLKGAAKKIDRKRKLSDADKENNSPAAMDAVQYNT